jgi:hypothetical protein
MKKFEYQVYRNYGISDEKLKQMGAWGWQLQVVVPTTPSLLVNQYYFMREIDAPRKCRNPGSTKATVPEPKPVSSRGKRRT